MKTKYYTGSIIDHVGERDITTTVFFATAGNPETKMLKIAHTWWGSAARMTPDGYDHGDIFTDAGEVHEISKPTFVEMTKFNVIL